MLFPRKIDWRRILPLFLLLTLLPAAALGAPALHLPTGFGRVVYRQHADNPLQIYIVANSHRSSATGANGAETVKAQAETFLIGEWLIERDKIDMLLPEGFFGRDQGSAVSRTEAKGLAPAVLEEKLADTAHFVNAELLLHRQFGIGLYQVESRNLYRKARTLLHAGLESGACLAPSFAGDLAYLQKRRLAAILQNTPEAMETARRQGHLAAPKAMLTIGLAHLADLLRFLQAGEIRIPAQPSGGDAFPPFQAQLALRNLGVTVIVPHVLLKDSEMVQTAALADDRQRPPSSSQN